MAPTRERSRVKRRWFAVMGVVVLFGLAAIAVVVDVPIATSAAFAVLVVGSLCFVLGGLDPVPDAVAWYRFVAVGELLFGSAFAVTLLAPVASGQRSTTALLFAAAGVANALLFGFVGVDWLRGGRHYDLSTFEPGPILGGDEGRGREDRERR